MTITSSAESAQPTPTARARETELRPLCDTPLASGAYLRTAHTWAERPATPTVITVASGAARVQSGTATALVDANQALVVQPGLDFVCSPATPEFAAVFLRLKDPGLVLSARSQPLLRLNATRVIHAAHRLTLGPPQPEGAALARDILQAAFAHQANPIRKPTQLIEAARQLMYDENCARMLLIDIAHTLSAAPKYLTNEFTRVFGIPLYQYQLRLRLNRALEELPLTESITELAFALGFSSHSHFTAAFRSAFGVTPSACRARQSLSATDRRSATL